MKQQLMTFEEWVDEYRPVKNASSPNASYDGLMFDTHGIEIQQIKDAAAKDPGKVWTLVDGDNLDATIESGMTFVNRMGYFVTEKSAPDDRFISVIDDPKPYLRALRKEGFFSNDPSLVYDLSPGMQQAWEEVRKRLKTKP